MNLQLDQAQLDRLRALRLWHWQQCLLYRSRERTVAAVSNRMISKWEWAYRLNADFHLSAVQTLNDFFPDPGDTAERDAAREAGQ